MAVGAKGPEPHRHRQSVAGTDDRRRNTKHVKDVPAVTSDPAVPGKFPPDLWALARGLLEEIGAYGNGEGQTQASAQSAPTLIGTGTLYGANILLFLPLLEALQFLANQIDGTPWVGVGLARGDGEGCWAGDGGGHGRCRRNTQHGGQRRGRQLLQCNAPRGKKMA